jgi:hypothetical protein
MSKYFRAPGSRIEHATVDSLVTLCGIDARIGARYTDAERGMDAKLRPLCSKCRAAI